MSNFQCKCIPNTVWKLSILKKNSAHCFMKFKFQWASYVFPSNSTMPVSHTRVKCFLTHLQFSSVQFSLSVVSDSSQPLDCSMPGLPVHHQLLEFTQTHVHSVSDAIQPSHSLSSPSPPALSLSQHRGLFKWVSSSHQVAKVLEFQLQHQSFQWILRTHFL